MAAAAAAAPAAGASAAAAPSGSQRSLVHPDLGFITRTNMAPTHFPRATVSVCTKIGKRKKQEDRLVVCPKLYDRDELSFYGIFDGTVGDFASEYAHMHMLENCVGNQYFVEGLQEAPKQELGFLSRTCCARFARAMAEAYRRTDGDLIERFRKERIDYSSSTSVVACITGDLLTLGHLGDSRIVLGREEYGTVVGQYLTRDHKPDQPEELKRIQSMGGSLAYLHGGKPFIRGGDFTARQAKGERPMQLNYSRAFGGKDLKPFGLSAEPSLLQLQLSREDRMLILASDGLWDVVDADTAVRRAYESHRAGRDPSEDLVEFGFC